MLQAPGSRLRAPGSGLQAPGSGLRAPGSGLRAPGSRLQAGLLPQSQGGQRAAGFMGAGSREGRKDSEFLGAFLSAHQSPGP